MSNFDVAAFVIGQEFFVDGLAAAEALVGGMPVFDGFFAKAPAKADLVAVVEGGKINEADIEILDLAAEGGDLLEDLIELLGGGLELATLLQEMGAVEDHAAGHGDFAVDGVEGLFGLVVRFFELDGELDEGRDTGQEPSGLFESKIPGHG